MNMNDAQDEIKERRQRTTAKNHGKERRKRTTQKKDEKKPLLLQRKMTEQYNGI
jgi:hypothetical protein